MIAAPKSCMCCSEFAGGLNKEVQRTLAGAAYGYQCSCGVLFTKPGGFGTVVLPNRGGVATAVSSVGEVALSWILEADLSKLTHSGLWSWPLWSMIIENPFIADGGPCAQPFDLRISESPFGTIMGSVGVLVPGYNGSVVGVDGNAIGPVGLEMRWDDLIRVCMSDIHLRDLYERIAYRGGFAAIECALALFSNCLQRMHPKA